MKEFQLYVTYVPDGVPILSLSVPEGVPILSLTGPEGLSILCLLMYLMEFPFYIS